MHRQEEIVINSDYSVFKWPHFPPYLSSDHYVPPDFVLPYWKSDSTKMSKLKDVLGYSYNHHNMTNDDVINNVKHMLADGSAVLVKKRNFFHPELLFDGRKLYWIDVGSVRKSWRAVSGRPGYQDKIYQVEKDIGPLPEGKWHVRQSRYQKISKRYAVQGMLTIIGADRLSGRWPGSVMAWGAHRVWIEPFERTNTFNRKDFSIHGGWVEGSAGCIDMASSISDFVSYFLEYGWDMVLTVEYK